MKEVRYLINNIMKNNEDRESVVEEIDFHALPVTHQNIRLLKFIKNICDC